MSLSDPATIAVLDVGKSNVKLSACRVGGSIAETLATANPVLPGPPWRHHDQADLRGWVMESLARLCRRHHLAQVICTGHGSGAVLVGDDPDAGGDGAALPMVDYVQPLPAGIDAAYIPMAGDFLDRGSAIMMASTHAARQMVWAEQVRPDAVAGARWLLGCRAILGVGSLRRCGQRGYHAGGAHGAANLWQQRRSVSRFCRSGALCRCRAENRGRASGAGRPLLHIAGRYLRRYRGTGPPPDCRRQLFARPRLCRAVVQPRYLPLATGIANPGPVCPI